MAIRVTMPKLSDTMSEGVISKWLIKEGDSVEAGQVLAEAESDKATMELEAFDSGILRKIVIKDGGKVEVGGMIAIIAEADEDISEILAQEPPAETPAATEAAPPQSQTPEAVQAATVPDKAPVDELLTPDSGRIKASPLARKLAQEQKIDLSRIQGTGTGGRIIRRDILDSVDKIPAELPATPAQPAAEELTLSSMREAIAKRMVLSKTTVPHFYATMEINMDPAIEFRRMLNASQSNFRISYNDLLIKAVALSLKNHPAINAAFNNNKITRHHRIDIGVAVALEDGLITPVVRNADSKSIGQIASDIRELADRAKMRKLTPPEYTNATFTISNLGMYGVEDFVAIINPPEVAILAVGGIKTLPVVQDNEIKIGNRMNVTLSSDHRAVDGAIAALFLRELKKWMENPFSLVL